METSWTPEPVDAVESIRRGLAQSAAGETESRGDFTMYVEDAWADDPDRITRRETYRNP